VFNPNTEGSYME